MAASKVAWIFMVAALLVILIRPSKSDVNCVGNRIRNDNGHCVDAITVAHCDQNTALSLMDCKEDLKEAKEAKSNTCHPPETTSHVTLTTSSETSTSTSEPCQDYIVPVSLVVVVVMLLVVTLLISLVGNWCMWRKSEKNSGRALLNILPQNGIGGAEPNVNQNTDLRRDNDNTVLQRHRTPATVANGSARPLLPETENSVEDGLTDVETAAHQHVIVGVEDAANSLSSIQSGTCEDTNLLGSDAEHDISSPESSAPLIARPTCEADQDSLPKSDCKNGWAYGSKQPSECENAVVVEIGRAEEKPDHDGKTWITPNQTVLKTNGRAPAIPLIQQETLPKVH